MQVTNANELASFMTDLKEWSKNHSFEIFVSGIESAEQTSFTASELIIKYSEVLKRLKGRLPDTLPPAFRDNWDRAIQVGEEGVQTVEYETKKRSIFSLG